MYIHAGQVAVVFLVYSPLVSFPYELNVLFIQIFDSSFGYSKYVFCSNPTLVVVASNLIS